MISLPSRPGGISPRALTSVGAVSAVASALLGLAYVGLGLSVLDGQPGIASADVLGAAIAKGSIAPLAAATLGAWSVGALFLNGGLATAFWLWPRRSRFAMLTAAEIGVAGAILGVLSAVVISALAFVVTDLSLGAGDLAASTLLHAFVCSGYAIIGGACAVLLRSRSAALSLVLAIPLVVEPTLRSVARVSNYTWLKGLAEALPGALAERLQLRSENPIVQVSNLLPQAAGAAVLLVLVIAVSALAQRRLNALDA